jgi:hypothetical protein
MIDGSWWPQVANIPVVDLWLGDYWEWPMFRKLIDGQVTAGSGQYSGG